MPDEERSRPQVGPWIGTGLGVLVILWALVGLPPILSQPSGIFQGFFVVLGILLIVAFWWDEARRSRRESS